MSRAQSCHLPLVFCLLAVTACVRSTSDPNTSDGVDGIVGGDPYADEPTVVYSRFRALGCVDSSGAYIEPPGGLYTISAIMAPPVGNVETVQVVLQPTTENFPRQIRNRYAQGANHHWLAYAPGGDAWEFVYPTDSNAIDASYRLQVYAPNTYSIEVVGRQYKITGKAQLMCDLSLVWEAKEFNSNFTQPTEEEFQARVRDYRASRQQASATPDTVSSSTADDPRDDARRLAYAGVDAFQAGHYPLAAERLSRAFQVIRAPSIGLWLARSFAKQGQVDRAAQVYSEVAALTVDVGDPEVQRDAQAAAARELTDLGVVRPITTPTEGAVTP